MDNTLTETEEGILEGFVEGALTKEDQLTTVCTVTAIIREPDDEAASRQEEASHLTTPTL